MLTTTPRDALARFRVELYRCLGLRKDTLFELMDAALVAPARGTLVRLSLAGPFRRRWPSAPDALAEGTLEAAGLRALLTAQEAAAAGAGRAARAAGALPGGPPVVQDRPAPAHARRLAPPHPHRARPPARSGRGPFVQTPNPERSEGSSPLSRTRRSFASGSG
jgi:hypothetical protein